MSQNVFSFSYRKRYYLKHPIRFFKEIWWMLRAAYMRATKGWCYGDVWELGYWFLDVMPPMLKYLADHGEGYKGETPEEWHDHLYGIANLLENAREEVRDQKNEYFPAYDAQMHSNWKRDFTTDEHGNRVHKPYDNEIVRAYLKRDRELEVEQDVMIEEALKLLAETPLKALWD